MDLVLNLSRVGKVGGLRQFAAALAECFEGVPGVVALLPQGIDLNPNIPQKAVPGWIATSGQVSGIRPILWTIFSAVLLPKLRKKRVLCGTHHVLPLLGRQIVTVHDLRPYYHSDNWVQRINFHHLLPRALRRCDGVLTVSEASRDLLVSIYGIDPEKIHVVPNVIDSEIFRAKLDGLDNPTDPYLLTVGSSWEHKNVEELIRMEEYWRDKYRLKIVGSEGHYMEKLMKLTAAVGLEDRIRFLTRVTADELLKLYQDCSALIYPSLMEGFGIPPLEAMACGRPVIVSDIQVFHELYGEAPVYVNLGDKESWRKAFAILESFSPARAKMGIDCARSFTHDRMRTALYRALIAIWGEDICLRKIETAPS